MSCSITRVKWRIKWDKDKKAGKQAFMSAPLTTETKNGATTQRHHPARRRSRALRGERLRRRAHLDPEHRSDRRRGRRLRAGLRDGAHLCASSGSGLMTGRVQNRYGFETQVMEFYPSNYVEYISGRWLVDTGEFKVKAKPSFPSAWQVHKQGTPPTEIMLSEILKKYNYQTALIGKWHLGVHKEQVPMARGLRLPVRLLRRLLALRARKELVGHHQPRARLV